MTQSGFPAGSVPVAHAGWYPDPARAHELRYYDGVAWTEHVSTGGQASTSPLGPPPPGLFDWFAPDVMVRASVNSTRLVPVPHVKMWILALLSAFVFRFSSPSSTIVLPVGIGFAIWCWRTTSPALDAHVAAHSPAVSEIKVARGVAVGFAVVCVLQIPLWMR